MREIECKSYAEARFRAALYTARQWLARDWDLLVAVAAGGAAWLIGVPAVVAIMATAAGLAAAWVAAR